MKIAFYDTKPYDREWFDKKKPDQYEIKYFDGQRNAIHDEYDGKRH